VDPAGGHRVERPPGDRERARVAAQAAAEEEFDRHRLGELRGAAPAAGSGVEGRFEARRRRVEHALVERAGGGRQPLLGDERVDEPNAGLLDLESILVPRAPNAGEDLTKRRESVPRGRREVRSAVEGPTFGRQEDRHRPAAPTGHCLDGRHVELVDLGPLLAVDLDRHEVAVELGGRRLVLEALALHDVAPMAGGVADRQEDRLSLRARGRERGLSPRVPVDGIVGVLEQVRARLVGEAVAVGSIGSH